MEIDDTVWHTIEQNSISSSDRPKKPKYKEYKKPAAKTIEEHSSDLDNSDNSDDSDDSINYTPSGPRAIIITKSGAFIKFEYLSSDIGKAVAIATKIYNYFTLKHKTITGYMHYLKCAKMDKEGKRIIVPRFGVFEILTKQYQLANFTTKSQITLGQFPRSPFVWRAKQTANQKIIADEIINKYYTKERVLRGSAGVIVNLEAGQGKSYLAAYLMSVIQRKTAIIMHSTALMDQWVKVLKTSFGDNISVGYYYGKKKRDGDVILLIVDSASFDEFKIDGEVMTPNEFYSQFGFIIIDECHTFTNSMALKALRSAQATYMLSLSATPDEHIYGYDKSVWWAVGPILKAADIPGFISTADDFKAEVHRIMYYGPSDHTKIIINEHTDLISTTGTVSMICNDKYRSQLVIDCIKEGLALNLYMFVFADRRAYLAELRDMLTFQTHENSEIVDSDTDFVRVVGGAALDDLEQAELTARVIFTTYQYMGTGKSVVKMNGLVLATPRKSKMKQYINRVFRLGSNMEITRHIWDICDMRLKLATQWRTRKIHYESKGYNIEAKQIHYEDIQLYDEVPESFKKVDKPKSSKKNKTKIIELDTPAEVELDNYMAVPKLTAPSNPIDIPKRINKKFDSQKISSIANSLVAQIKNSQTRK